MHLFVGAHADDVELFAGATIARFAPDVRVLVFSKHKGVFASASDEFAESMRRLDVSVDWCHDFDACNVGVAGFAHNRQAIFDFIKEAANGCHTVVTHQPTDTNQDHMVVHDEVMRACRLTHEIWHGVFMQNDWPVSERNLFVEVSKENVASKVDAINMYESQKKEWRSYFDPMAIWAQARYFGAMAGTEFAEAFLCQRTVKKL